MIRIVEERVTPVVQKQVLTEAELDTDDEMIAMMVEEERPQQAYEPDAPLTEWDTNDDIFAMMLEEEGPQPTYEPDKTDYGSDEELMAVVKDQIDPEMYEPDTLELNSEAEMIKVVEQRITPVKHEPETPKLSPKAEMTEVVDNRTTPASNASNTSNVLEGHVEICIAPPFDPVQIMKLVKMIKTEITAGHVSVRMGFGG